MILVLSTNGALKFRIAEANFSLFTIPFSLFFVSLQHINQLNSNSYGYYSFTPSWMFGWLIMNCILGLFGGVLGGWLFDLLGISWGGLLGQLGTAIIGAVVILWIASLIKK